MPSSGTDESTGLVVAALLAEADRLDALALVLPDFADAATTRALAERTRAQATALALSPDDED